MEREQLESLGVRVTHLGDGVQYDLPRRKLGPWRLLGVIPLLLGLFVVLVPFRLLHGVMDDPGTSVSLLLAGITLLFAAVGLLPAAVGLTLIAGSSRLTLKGDRAIVSEGIGPLRKRWKRRLDDLRGVVAGMPSGGSKHEFRHMQQIDPARLGVMRMPGLAKPVSCVVLVFESQSPLVAALGYPHETAAALAEDLAGVVTMDHREALFAERGGPVRLLVADAATAIDVSDDSLATAFTTGMATAEGSTAIGTDDAEPTEAVIPPKPSESRCTLDVRDDGLQIIVPPVGLIKGSKGMFVFAIVWLLFTGGIGVVLVGGGIGSGGGVFEVLFPLLLLLVFVSVGVVMLVYSIHAGRRRAILDVVGDALLVSRQGLFGFKQDEFDAADIAAIRIGKTNTEINGRPVMELQIHTAKGRKLGLLSQLSDEEIQWVAAVLRTALGVRS